ncbi:WD repeat and coiled-coil-containing protein [Callorhinchus milii]|uniref:WD repeat and coiled-coil-containing protein n=1 Tax=Callorhinchus milii TaxID=7868 RepID=UPI001C3FB214|nr:WD repeat and coiled-coil-containing protein [Callorhinchus milii]
MGVLTPIIRERILQESSMDLGKAKLLRTGINALHQALHPIHGIAWTDGKQVALTVVCLVNGEVKFGDSNVIGCFEHVHGLYWGSVCCTGALALLAVQHKKHITVWQLQHSTLENNKLLVSQTCELGEIFPILPQGCVWHPKSDALVVLTKRDASVLFAVQTDNRRVKADIKGSGLIHCACWTKDGNRLVIAIGSTLHSYIWNDSQKTLNPCNFCPIFDVGGYICAIEASMDMQVAVATELPLDKICGLNAGMAFDVTGEMGSLMSRSSVITVDEDCSMEVRRRSIDSERSLAADSIISSSSSACPIELTHLLANHRKSDPSPLIHLKRRDSLTGSGHDSSHLILVTFERKVTTTRKVSVPGILVPDIITFDSCGHTIVVASNSCNTILVYSVTPSSMPNIQQIHLQKNERPKGLCFLTEKILLLLIGKQKSNDPAFLPSSNSDRFLIRLMTKKLVANDPELSESYQTGQSAINIPGMRKYFENLSKEEQIAGRELLLPGSTIIQSPSGRRRLIEEVRSAIGEEIPEMSSPEMLDGSTPCDSSVTLASFDAEPINRSVTILGRAGTPNRDLNSPVNPKEDGRRLSHASISSKNGDFANEKIEHMSRNMEQLYGSFSEMKQCISQISDYTRNGKKSMVTYPSAFEPPFIYIFCQKKLLENTVVDEKRVFLLCEGKLRLSMIQDIFNLCVVEMFHGSNWIVLMADNDGFIPLLFKHKQQIMIRDGNQVSQTAEFPPPPPPLNNIDSEKRYSL